MGLHKVSSSPVGRIVFGPAKEPSRKRFQSSSAVERIDWRFPRLKTTPVLPNPDPSKWVVEQKTTYSNGWVVLLVSYPGCTNYEGRKILVFDDEKKLEELLKSGLLDPHFDDKSYGPIARFEPSARGVELANLLAQQVKSEKP